MKSVARWLALLSLIAAAAAAGPALAQVAPTAPPPQESEPTQLDDVVVVTADVEQTARAYVAAVGAPPEGREPAAWRRRICVGVGGMSPEPARALADRVLDWGYSLGLEIGPPGCTPDIFIVATDDGNATARELVTARPRAFRTGAGGMDRGGAALRAFQESGRPIRWWHVSLPVNEDNGRPAIRLPGQQPFVAPPEITRPSQLGSFAVTGLASRLSDQIRDDLQQVIVVLDSSALEQASFMEVADYVAMIALAQVDPQASPEVPSILNLFDPDRPREETLSAWDRGYLRALYTTYLDRSAGNANAAILAGATAREVQAQPVAGDEGS
ncbi:hypothetical protein [Brevundimonas sp. LjRoot202]|uniref:hypothetical protein n=1 Tax=Brevundimonas sp. LjRoot202 TaxID=3342281 RepID=UPI003ED0972C